jgi:ABC-type transporter Mla subunit MlaD
LTTTGRQALEGTYDQLAGNAETLLDVLGPSRPQFLQSLRRLRDTIALAEASLDDGKPPALR